MYRFWVLLVFTVLFTLTATVGAENTSRKNQWYSEFSVKNTKIANKDTIFLGGQFGKNISEHLFTGASIYLSPTNNSKTFENRNIHTPFYTGLVFGYDNIINQRIGYSINGLIGFGIGEYTQVDGDVIGVCQCVYSVIEPSVEGLYLLSPNTSLGIQVNWTDINFDQRSSSSFGLSITLKNHW